MLTGLESPERPVVLVIRRAEASDALRKRDLEGLLEFPEFCIGLTVGLAPEGLSVVNEKSQVLGASPALARLVRADGDGEGLCKDGPLVFVETGADYAVDTDWGEAKVALEGEVTGTGIAMLCRDGELDHVCDDGDVWSDVAGDNGARREGGEEDGRETGREGREMESGCM